MLLNKLRSFGIGGNLLRSLASYLTNRAVCQGWKLFIFMGFRFKRSSTGLILGPLLFLVIINDLPSAGVSSFYLFADDGKALNDDLQTLQNDVESYLNWARRNSMIFNVSKIQFLLVGKTNDHCFSNIGGEVVHPVNIVKDLCIYVSENLKWDVHILRRLGLCFSLLTSLKRNLRFELPLQTKLTMYKSFLLSPLLYGSEIWSPSSAELTKLGSFQIKRTKWICSGSSYRDRLLQFKCKLLPICCMLQLKDLTMLNRILTGKYDSSVMQLILIQYNQRLRSSSKPILILNRTKKSMWKELSV